MNANFADWLKPAINTQNVELPNELTAAEFQQGIHLWIEECGMMSDLRAHLRTQLIRVLKDTAIGRALAIKQQKIAVSPKLQAINLVVAEYLLTYDYHYTLSVFSTEVPMFNVLPEVFSIVVNRPVNSKWKFKRKEIWDILETLGFHRNTASGEYIFSSYIHDSNADPLLTCIIRTINEDPKRKSKNKLNVKEIKYNYYKIPWMAEIIDILTDYHIEASSVEKICDLLKEAVRAERRKIHEKVGQEYVKMKHCLEQETNNIQEEQKKMLEQIQETLERERNKIKIEKEQQKLDNLIAQIGEQQIELKNRFEMLNSREDALRKRECVLLNKEQKLKKHFEELHSQHNLSSSKHAVDKATATEKEESDDLKEYQETVKHLQIENKNLKILNNTKNTQIKDLSQKAAHLIKDLEISQVAMKILRKTKSLEVVNRQKEPTNNAQNLISSKSSSEENTTRILEQAKVRLKCLEEESKQVERRFRNFKKRHRAERAKHQIKHTNLSDELKKGKVDRNSSELDESDDILDQLAAKSSGLSLTDFDDVKYVSSSD